jgi:hypothetical protein
VKRWKEDQNYYKRGAKALCKTRKNPGNEEEEMDQEKEESCLEERR